ncbi:MAG TPA: DUF6152 family protein [Bryobacteraceae bacterium]|jgi:hypothetical protein|nr:DUF6152 family protein [Bryobacteraceae bacterium]
MRIRRAWWLAACTLTIAGLLMAHHSFAMYDRDHQITLTGTVTKFEWTNPHAYVELDVPDSNGVVKHYSIECASPNVLTRIGWKFNDLKTGDKATLLINPLKNGKAGGMLEKATLPDGRTLGDGNPPSGRFDRQ